MLEAERNSLLLTINIKDKQLERLADVKKCGRVADAAPTHVGNVKQAIHALKVNKGTEVGDILDLTFHLVANLDALEEVLTHFCALAFDHFTA